MKTWQLDAARNRFGELARRALAHHPQRVQLGEQDAIVVVNAADYATLTFANDLVDFVRRSMAASGALEAELDRPRPQDLAHDAGRMEDA